MWIWINKTKKKEDGDNVQESDLPNGGWESVHLTLTICCPKLPVASPNSTTSLPVHHTSTPRVGVTSSGKAHDVTHARMLFIEREAGRIQIILDAQIWFFSSILVVANSLYLVRKLNKAWELCECCYEKSSKSYRVWRFRSAFRSYEPDNDEKRCVSFRRKSDAWIYMTGLSEFGDKLLFKTNEKKKRPCHMLHIIRN